MAVTFRLAAHTVRQNAQVVEIWDDGEFVGQITAADTCGIRVISKWHMRCREAAMVVEVTIDAPRVA